MSLLDHLRMQGSAQTARLGNARYGLVTAVDPTNHAVKVTIQPEDVESGWIPDPGLAAGQSLKIASPCEIGTQVLVEAADGDAEQPVVVGRLFDAVMTAPVSPVTNKQAQPGEFLIATGQATVHVQPNTLSLLLGNARITMTAQSLTLAFGNVGLVLSNSGIAFSGGPVTSDTDFQADNISLVKHVHAGVQTGSSMTGLPQG